MSQALVQEELFLFFTGKGLFRFQYMFTLKGQCHENFGLTETGGLG